MKSQSTGLKVASVIFGLVSLGHILRVFRGFRIIIGSHDFGRGLSVAVIIVSGLLCVWMWKLAGPGCSGTQAPVASKS
jgi:hypothetical protein